MAEKEKKPEAPVGEKVNKEEFVQVKKEDLAGLFTRLDKYEKDIQMLYKVSDKSRLQREQNTGGVLINTVKISRWDGGTAHVIAWKLDSNRCEVVNGRWVEDQQATVILDEGEPVTVPLLEFYRKIIQKDVAEIIGREKKYDKQNNSEYEIFKVELPNGQTLEINSQFVN